MSPSRRDFLRQSGCALGAAALLSSIERFGLVNALAQSAAPTDYRALVCVFLSGGNDGNNMIIPYDGYSAYSSVRAASTLAIPQANLLQISPISTGGVKYGLHPNMPEMQSLFNQQKLAVLCNTGTLVEPLTKSVYQSAPSKRPYQLFSHSDQVAQQQSSVSNAPGLTGWGGRTSDALVGVNGNAPLPMIVSIAGTSLFASGKSTHPLAIADARTNLNQVLVLSMSGTTADVNARRAAFDQIRGFDNEYQLVKASSDTTTQALQTSAALSTNPTLSTIIPNTTLGYQLQQVAKLLRLRDTLGMKRQIFFVSLGGFDSHSNQRTAGSQDGLLTQVSQALKAFYDETVAIGISDQVTTFTISDFGRTLQPAGSGAAVGSDHAWGNHQLIMGGAVKGGDFYGTFPTLALGGPDDTDSGTNPRGRWIPTTSVDQYAATLASWYGLSSADIPTVFPFIGRFASSNLGFLM
jgi:uncharacterized protein (DUF1501 family)